jgi:hypothetical protein
MRADGERTRIEQKWGFGMAPVKVPTQRRREEAAGAVAAYLDGSPFAPEAEQLSEVKGLFSRAHRQDQWDWFTVWQQLGRPGRPVGRESASAVDALRHALREGTRAEVVTATGTMRQLGLHRRLPAFPRADEPQPGFGWVYVLSTREQPRMLKIGFTNRPVEQRVAEINSATGVVVPFGVRAVWTVRDARDVERQLHQHLSRWRVRADREFFELEWNEAFPLIRDFVADHRLEI